MQKVSNCGTYKPDSKQFNPTRPAPTLLGKLKVCEASEREIWATGGDYFKVAGPKGYNADYDALVVANPDFGTETRTGKACLYLLTHPMQCT
jgi:hypothetical protein